MWSCSQCTYSNSPESLTCEICRHPHCSPPSSKACPQCTLFNSQTALQCQSCDYLFLDSCMASSDSSMTNIKRKRGLDDYIDNTSNESKHVSPNLSGIHSHDQFITLLTHNLRLQPDSSFQICGSTTFISQLTHSEENTRGWGCGYRNFQMLCSFIVRCPSPYFSDCLVHQLWESQLGSIHGIQETISNAWNTGYDMSGADLFEWKIVNTNKWIGATGDPSFYDWKC